MRRSLAVSLLLAIAPDAGAQVTTRVADQSLTAVALSAGAELGSSVAIAAGPPAALASAPSASQVFGIGYNPTTRSWALTGSLAWSGPAPARLPVGASVSDLVFARPDEKNTTSIQSVVEGSLALVGGSVAAVAITGDYLAIGQPDFDGGRGRVVVFAFEEGAWVFDDAFEGEEFSRLGESVAVHGLTVVAGAPGEGDCGAVHHYVRASSWLEFPAIDCPSSVQVDAEFGAAVALHGDNLVVGAPRLDRLVPSSPNVPDVGGIYTFSTSLLTFELETFFRPANAAANDRFGSSVALWRTSGHGLVLAAGSPREDAGAVVDSGAVYLYLRQGANWQERLRLVDSTPDGAAKLGAAVAIGPMGVLGGEPGNDDNGVAEQGAIVAWNGVVPLFYDGFESGDTGGWSDSTL
jgi:hypothetical protein